MRLTKPRDGGQLWRRRALVLSRKLENACNRSPEKGDKARSIETTAEKI